MVKFFIGNNKDKASRENFYAYIRQIKQQSDFVSFDYWLGVAIENTGRTVQQINSELREQAREYSRKMARRPSLGMEAGYYASLRNDVEKLYNAFIWNNSYQGSEHHNEDLQGLKFR